MSRYFSKHLGAILIAFLLSSCVTSHPPILENSDFDVRERRDLEGRLLSAVARQISRRPFYDQTTPALEFGGEFYQPVRARFPAADPKSRSVLVREMRWQYEDWYLAVLCERHRGVWVVFDAVELQKDVQF